MEFGARYCKPRNPDCERCVFNTICLARQNKQVHELPVKANKTKVRDRFFQYLVIRHKKNTWLRQRVEKDIWEGLYEFPLIESKKLLTESQLQKSAQWKRFFKDLKPVIPQKSKTYKHLLSHQRIYAVFWEVEVEQGMNEKEWKKTSLSKLQDFAIPRLVDLYLSERA
jgi:A/G-specific adenine glycosylase